jgi:uncharacterized protein (TIGR02118 family)
MVHVTVLYHPPADPAAFMAYYYDTHVPLAKKLPGLRAYTVSDGPILNADGTGAPYALVADLTFDDAVAFTNAMASPEGRAVVADLANFASGGVTILTYDARPV